MLYSEHFLKCKYILNYYRRHMEYDGKVMFSVFLSVHRGGGGAGKVQVKVQGSPRSKSGSKSGGGPRSRSRPRSGRAPPQGQFDLPAEVFTLPPPPVKVRAPPSLSRSKNAGSAGGTPLVIFELQS